LFSPELKAILVAVQATGGEKNGGKNGKWRTEGRQIGRKQKVLPQIEMESTTGRK
jgi:hypothetical protein